MCASDERKDPGVLSSMPRSCRTMACLFLTLNIIYCLKSKAENVVSNVLTSTDRKINCQRI